jgi:aspartyl protease family protein
MRGIIVFAVCTLVIAGLIPRFLANATNPAAMSVTTNASAPTPTSYDYRTVTLFADRRGHFQVNGMIDGRPMNFMVDTGASVIALRESDASRLGVHPSQRDYTAQVKTANGAARAAPVRLDRVEIGGLAVNNVAAIVMPDEMLTENLLGMSFLSQLRRVEMGNGRLVLER